MDREMLDYYRLTILLLSAVGLWPHQREKLRLFQNVVISFIITIPMVAQFTPYASGKSPKEDFLKNVSFIIISLGGLTKYFLFWHNIQLHKKLMEGVNSDWKIADDEELKIIKKHAYMGKHYSTIFAVFVYLSTFGVIARWHFDIVVPLNETRYHKTLIVTEYFIDEQKYFYQISVYQDIGMLIVGTTYAASESLTFMWMVHSSCLYRLVSYRINIAVLDSIDGSYGTGKAYKRNRREGVMRAVRMHNRAHTFLQDVKSAITLLYSILVILGVTSLSTNLFCLTQSALDQGNVTDALISLLFIISEIIYMFYINYIMQQVIDSCDEVFTATYHTEWYKLPVSTQKLLLFIMLKSVLTPDCKILLAYNLSIEFFSKLLRTSVSYFMVMSSMQ